MVRPSYDLDTAAHGGKILKDPLNSEPFEIDSSYIV